ncbi:MAG: hypothetical protein EXS27_02235 [Pedosphaera sp.]|nr:hypothetical protein [Pedosphaera sp.]
MVTMKFPLCLLLLISFPLVAAALLGDPVAPWKANVRVAPVSPVAGRHSIHSYYVANPESPDGKLMVTDGLTDTVGGQPTEWGIMVADMNGGKWALLHSFVQSKGALSWRRNDPHPAFSADGKRIYYNVSDGEFTRLFVAERGQP